MSLPYSDARRQKSDEKKGRLRRKNYEVNDSSMDSIDSGLSDLSFENTENSPKIAKELAPRGIHIGTQTETLELELETHKRPTLRQKPKSSRRPLEKQQSADAGAVLNDYTVQSIQIESGQYVHRILKISEKSALNQLQIIEGDVILEVNNEATMDIDSKALIKALKFNALRFQMLFGRLEEGGDKLIYLHRHFTIQREFPARSSFADHFSTEPKIWVTLLSMSPWGSDSDLETDSESDAYQCRVVARAILESESKTYIVKYGSSFYWRWTGGEVVIDHRLQENDKSYHFVMRNYIGKRETGEGIIDMCVVAPWSLKNIILQPTYNKTTSTNADIIDGKLETACYSSGSLCADRCLFEYCSIRTKYALKSTTEEDVCLGVEDAGNGPRCVLISTKQPEQEARAQFIRIPITGETLAKVETSRL